MANEFKIKKGLIVTGASGGTVVDIQGSQGQLFSVTDDLSGSIFTVSDISGVPILDINSSGVSYFDGNVGIGTTSPDFKLVSLSTVTDADEFTIVAAKSNSIGYFTGIGLSGYEQVVKAGIVLDRSGNYGVGDLHFLNNNTADTSDATLSDSKITIKADGNVGIGTQSPSAQLHVGPSLSLPSGYTGIKTIIHGGAFINLQEEDVKVFGIFCAPNGESILQIDTDPQRFLIDPSGNNETKVGIGTDSPSTLLEIASGGNTDAAVGSPTFRINNTTNDSSWAVGDVVGTLEYYSSDPGGNAPYITSFIKSVNENNGGTAPSGALTFGTTAFSAAGGAVERLRITDGGDVGIGTTTPDYRLDLQSTDSTSIRVKSTGTGATDNAFLRLEIGGTDASNAIAFGSASNAFQGQIRYVHSDNYMAFHGNGNLERMRIVSNGDVGIGTNAPGDKLEVAGAINAKASNGFKLGNSNETAIGKWYSTSGVNFLEGDATRSFQIGSVTNGVNVRFDNANNRVGIGTTSPDYTLDVQSSADSVIRVKTTGTGPIDDSEIRMEVAGTTQSHYIRFGDSDSSNAGWIKYQHFNDSMQFRVNNAERMRITEDGDIGIGTSTPGQALTVGDSTSTGNYILVEGSNSDNTYTVFEGKRKYPKLILTDTISGGSSFSLWNLGNQLRFGTNVGSAANAAWYTKSGDAADVIFNGDVGIGTTSPGSTLEVDGTINVNIGSDTMLFTTNTMHWGIGDLLAASGGAAIKSSTGIVGEIEVYTDSTLAATFKNDNRISGVTDPTAAQDVATKNYVDDLEVAIAFAISDETTALTVGIGKLVFRMPYAMTITDVRASVTTPPTGSTIIVDIDQGGSSIFTTNKLSIDANESTSTTAATPPNITTTSLNDDVEIVVNIDQVGSTVAGTGLKVYLIGTRA